METVDHRHNGHGKWFLFAVALIRDAFGPSFQCPLAHIDGLAYVCMEIGSALTTLETYATERNGSVFMWNVRRGMDRWQYRFWMDATGKIHMDTHFREFVGDGS